MDNVNVYYNKYDNNPHVYKYGTTLLEISKDFQKYYDYPILVAKVNGVSASLDYQVYQDTVVEFFDRTSNKGYRAYERSAIFILSKALKEVINSELRVEHSLDKGIYCKSVGINEKNIELVKKKMYEIVEKDYPIQKLTVNRLRVMYFYENLKMYDHVNILKYSTDDYIKMYKLDDMYDYLYGEMVLSTKYVTDFNLEYVKDDGFMLMLPFIYDDQKVNSYIHHESFFNSVMKFIDWTEKVGIRNFAELNEKISTGLGNDLVFMNEAHFNRNLLSIADTVADNRDIKLVLIAGPSCSGKTTTSKKLELFLRSRGLMPLALSTDDYFLEREETPLDEDGNRDYESVNALDIDLFNDQLSALINGEEVLMPTFNFITGKKEYNKKVRLPENGVLIIEGLHCLNDDLTAKIDKKNKYKIYISPITALNVDVHTRLNSTDNRLLRRMVRDYLTRGYSASTTLESWDRVRKGETKYVFPYQDRADIILNTVLVYEMSVLKVYAEPLLFSIPYDDPNYGEAMRLLGILSMLLPMPSDSVPLDSIMREFIGGGYFEG